jgi:hypothetical protein
MGKELQGAESQVYNHIRSTLINAKQKVYSVINSAMVEAYWEIGRQIMEAQDNNPRAEYGAQLLKYLSEKLTGEFGKGFDESSLRRMRQFYQVFPIRATLSHELSGSHYRLLMKIDNAERREFYLKECAESNWSVRQLERQVTTFYYERLLATQKSGKANENEIGTKTIEIRNYEDIFNTLFYLLYTLEKDIIYSEVIDFKNIYETSNE